MKPLYRVAWMAPSQQAISNHFFLKSQK